MSNISPFTLYKFEDEYEGGHLYFLPPDIFSRLEVPKRVYLIGSRGTGKTTLLNALNWKERTSSKSLQRAITQPFLRDYVGVYYRAPEYQTQLFDEWLEKSSDGVKAQTIGMYFELIWIFLISNALADIVAQGYFKATPGDEHKVLNKLFEKEPRLFPGYDKKEPCSFKQFAKFVDGLRKDLELHARLQSRLEVLKDFPIGNLGELSRIVAPVFAEYLNDMSEDDKPPWYFKVCIDETEYLTSFQRIVLNSLARLSKHPLFLVIAFVRKPNELSHTFLPHLPMTQADRDLVELDKISDNEFRDFVEGVATVRARAFGKDDSLTFNTKSIFGKLDINELLEKEILGTSASKEAEEWLNKAESLRSSTFPVDNNDEDSKPEKTDRARRKTSLPIYQAYLVEKTGLELLTTKDSNRERRRQQSATTRKQMVAAYLSLCNDLGKIVRYAYADMVLQMSDKCIRDFLAQLDMVYIQVVKKTVKDFLNMKINLKDQDKALRLTSQKKMDSIPDSGLRAPGKAGRLIDALAKITAIIQSRSPDMSHLRSIERGRFVLEIPPQKEKVEKLLLIITDAAEAGFLKIFDIDSKQWIFQVHCSLAAAHGFSYRGAQYLTNLSINDIEMLIGIDSDIEFDKKVKKLGEKLAGDDMRQMELF